MDFYLICLIRSFSAFLKIFSSIYTSEKKIACIKFFDPISHTTKFLSYNTVGTLFVRLHVIPYFPIFGIKITL